MAISDLLSASHSSRTCRPRPLSSSGILGFPAGSRFLPRFHFSLPGNGRELEGGDDDLPSGGGGGGGGGEIGGEGSSNASTENALAMALHEHTKEEKDVVSSCLGSAISTTRIYSSGNNNDEIEKIMSNGLQMLQNTFQQIGNNQATMTKLLSENARSQATITNLHSQNERSQTMITDLLEQTVNSRQTVIANLLEQTVTKLTMMQDVLTQIANNQTKMIDVLAQMMKGMPTTKPCQDPSIVPVVANSSRDDDLVNRRKGLLGFTYTIADKMILLHVFLVNFGCNSHPDGKVSSDNIFAQVICVVNLMSAFSSIWVAAFAFMFKERELTDNGQFEIFLWLLLLELLAFITLCFITIGVFTKMSIWVLCPSGITCFCCTALMWAYYYERPKFLMMKMGCFHGGSTMNPPEQQVQTGPNHIP